MSAAKRALLYIRRKKGKTILLLLIFCVVSILILTGMTINNAAEKSAAQLRESIGGYFKVARQGNNPEAGRVDDALVEIIETAGGIKTHNAMDTLYLTAKQLSLKPARFTNEDDSKARLARVLSNTDSSLHEYFVLDILKLAKGRHVTAGDTGAALVSRELADRNGLQPGDKLSLSITEDVIARPELMGKAFDMTVAGIFTETDVMEPGMMTPECDLPANFIFIDQSTGRKIKDVLGGGADFYNGGAAFFVEDPRNLDAITNGLLERQDIAWDSLELTKNNKAYERAMAPLERLSGMSRTMTIIIVVVGIALISLLLLMWTRDRIREVGVLMSAGIRKSRIFLQQFLECVLIFAAAFALACVVSIPVANQIGAMLYDNAAQDEQVAQQESIEAYRNEPVGLQDVEVSAKPEIRPSVGSVAAAGGIGFALVTLSVGLSFLTVARRKPKDLLTIME